MSDDVSSEAVEEDLPQPEWAIVEIMGHRRHAGLAQEVQRFGAAMLRLDIYGTGDTQPRRTYFYGGSAIFSYVPCQEAGARRIVDHELESQPPAQARLSFAGDPEDDDDFLPF